MEYNINSLDSGLQADNIILRQEGKKRMEYKEIKCYCTISDKDNFMEWLMESGYRRERSYSSSGLYGGWFDDNWRTYFYNHQDIFNGATNIFRESIDETDSRSNTKKFLELINYLANNEQKMAVYYTDEFATLAGYGQQRYILPTKWLIMEELRDYSHLTVSQLNAIGANDSITGSLMITGDMSKSDLDDMVSKQKSKMDALQQQIYDVNNAKTKELKALQEEIDRKKAELEEKKNSIMEELRVMQTELAKQMAELRKQVYILETQIYGIRCYLGEVVDFHQLTKGNPADIKEPVVLFQKIRFLDEEMGKAIALYDFDGSDCATFQDVLRYREDIRELFVPTEKCISLVKVSSTRSHIGQSSEVANILSVYEVYHGTQLGVIIRNGENLHIAWLDEDKISIRDENMFFSNKQETTQVTDNEYFTGENSAASEIVSRYFIFSLLQGILDNSNMVSIPEKANIIKQNSPYVVFSSAEGWLADTTYGMFSDIINRVNQIPFLEGDMVLTALHISRDDYYREKNEKYKNDRGIGEKNRTHDAEVPSFKILPVNKVIKKANYEFIVQELKVIHEGKWVPVKGESFRTYKTTRDEITDEVLREKAERHTYTEKDKEYGCVGAAFVDFRNPDDEDNIRIMVDDYNVNYGKTIQSHGSCGKEEHYVKKYISGRFTGMEYEYYLSAYKYDSWWSGKGPSYANLQFYSDEAIPLNYLNSGWTMYAITTKNIGQWKLGGLTLSYGDAIKYLNKINSYLKDRELKEAEMLKEAGLEEWIKSNSDWMVQVCEWRIENRIRNLTLYQAKRFRKHLDAKEKDK